MSSRDTLAAIFGLGGAALSGEERAFFREANPLGFILFARNCVAPDQVRRLVTELRDTVGRADAPVLIDQEGGRVARLKPPHWPDYPAAAAIAALAGTAALAAARLGARLIADDLGALGITVDCMPVLDLPVAGADAVIGDRAYGTAPDHVAALGAAVCDGLLAGGVLPVIKHIPGHGRATVDSHRALPVVTAPRAVLAVTDFAPFRALAACPWAMTAHVLYRDIDASLPATLSARLIAEVIRASIGFDGLLLSDDLSMAALPGGLDARAAGALAAGCDVVLHCNGAMDEMIAVAGAASSLSPVARRRIAAAEARRRGAREPFDRAAATARFAALMAGEG
ncbi:MAG TPA: beta-N-acetylhexosaminidase [Stellaceae bacterium]|nr:beta-N-acetylhexosaminidase [Stellaceae bacterium]